MIGWDIDDRPPTPYTRLYVKGMWLARDKAAFEGERHTLAKARQEQRAGDAPPTRLTRRRTRVREERLDGMTVWVVRPRRVAPRARVVYVHGGGYIHPLSADYWRLVRSLTRVPAEVVVPAYPLAPGATVDEVLPRLVDLAGGAASGELPGPDGPLPTVLMGDSAGGALVLSMSRLLTDRDRPPAGVVALSPWLDASLRDEAVRDLEASDPMLAESGLRAAGRWWAGPRRSPEDPMVSPVDLDLDGLPPVDLFIGEHDILRPAVDHLADRAAHGDVDLHVHEVAAMFHVWMTRAIPEAVRTRRDLVDIVRARAGIAGDVAGSTAQITAGRGRRARRRPSPRSPRPARPR
jgi:acetyl esterase/lipase